MPNELSIGFAICGNLLSPHYLKNWVTKHDDWITSQNDPRATQIQALYEKCRPLLAKNKPQTKGSNEQAVRDHLLNPIFEILGLPWSPAVHHFGKQLDYALYDTQQSRDHAQSLITEGREVEAMRTSCAVVEAERWGKSFGDKPKKLDLSDPIFQIEFYLGNARRSDGPRWGVLTNGHTWRLYCSDSDPLRHDFLEIELPGVESLFSAEEQKSFHALVYFFSSDALRRGGRLDHLYQEATRQAAAVTAELRRQAYGAVELLGSGLMKAKPDCSPVLAYEASLIQLFRLLFILKAEADGLLRNRTLSEDIADRIIRKNGDMIGGGQWEGRNFWHELNDIFEQIANEYNGHLFDSHPPTSSPAATNTVDYFDPARVLLESVTLPNECTANAIDRLLRVYEASEGQISSIRVDYSTLRVRELGTIYEGLLEWDLRPVTQQEIDAGATKLLGDKRIERRVEPGDFKLDSNQADRKATGSYYTPHSVVDFIARNELSILLDEIEAECAGDARKILNAVFEQRILDPAMGSGHFLVFAVDYLASYAFGQVARIRAELGDKSCESNEFETEIATPVPLDSTIEFIRARIAENCIYGVDINPLAVELAKLSLWISTASKGVPLSFLNHHLRCGDSLLGVELLEFKSELFASSLALEMAQAVKFIRKINDTFSTSLKEVGEKEESLKVAQEHLRRFRLTYDALLAPQFGAEIGEWFQVWLENDKKEIPDPIPQWLKEVEDIASKFRFFHWELEFPEVWRDRSGYKLGQNGSHRRPGFDLILGNPPFVTAKSDEARQAYLERWNTAIKGFHLLVPFFERAYSLLRPGGRIGLIVSNAFAKREFGVKLVNEFFPTVTINEIVDCGGLSFPGHGTPTLIIFGRSATPDGSGEVLLTTTIKGDLLTDPEISPLWRTTRDHHRMEGYKDEWITVTKRPQADLAEHPWIFDDNANLVELFSEVLGLQLKTQCCEPIGAQFITGADDVYVVPWHVARRSGIEQKYLRKYGTGEDVRDWQVISKEALIFPYDNSLRTLAELTPHLNSWLTPFREHLENAIISGSTPKKNTKLKWFEYRRLARKKFDVDQNIIFPQIAMFNHACLTDHTVAFKEKAQAIALKETVEPATANALVALLNSSSAAYWLKHVCFNKGAGKKGDHDRFEFSGKILEGYVIPNAVLEKGPIQARLAALATVCTKLGQDLSTLEASLLFTKVGEAYEPWYRGVEGYIRPHPLISQAFETREDFLANWEKARIERSHIRKQMIAVQEEVDWLTYAAYGLIPLDHRAVGIDGISLEPLMELAAGERPFELATISALPARDWDQGRKDLWQARLALIRESNTIASLENLLFKRRWVEIDFSKGVKDCLFEWLREKAEFYLENSAGEKPLPVSDLAVNLWRDPRVKAATQAVVGEGLSAGRFRNLLEKALNDQTVPIDQALWSPSHKQLRGKLNVHRERFHSTGSGEAKAVLLPRANCD